VAFAPDGRTLATVSGDQIVTLWDVAVGRERTSVPAQFSKSLRIATASDGRTLAVAGWDGNPGSVRLWRIPPDPERRLVATSALAAFSADGHRLALWHLATEPERTVAGPVHEPTSPAFSMFSEPQAVQIKDIPLGQEIYTLRADQNYVWALAFSPDGQTLATGGFDETVKLWDVGTGQERATLQGHTDQVGAIAFAPDGKVLASGSHDTTVKIWSAATGEELVNFHGHTGTVTCVAFDPTGQWIASGSHDRTVRLWPTTRVQ
jgi:WD40 repeat protein